MGMAKCEEPRGETFGLAAWARHRTLVDRYHSRFARSSHRMWRRPSPRRDGALNARPLRLRDVAHEHDRAVAPIVNRIDERPVCAEHYRFVLLSARRRHYESRD